MNNWRLLLLAFVAVFQPITPFNDHLVDGRQECCDRQTPTLLRDTRSPLHGTYRHDKASLSALLVHHNAYREQRQIPRRDSSFRDSVREILSDSQERNIRIALPGTARLARATRRLERDTNELNRNRGLGGPERERTSRNIPDSRITRYVREFAAQSTAIRQDEKHNIESVRSSSFRVRIADERSFRKMVGSEGNVDRTRSVLSRDRLSYARNNVARVPPSLDSEVNLSRLTSGTNRKESSLRFDVKSRITNNRDDERRSRSESPILIRRVRDSGRLFRSQRDFRRTVSQERRHYDQRNDQGFKNHVSANLLINERLDVRRDVGKDVSKRSRESRKIRGDHRTLTHNNYGPHQENRRMFRNELNYERNFERSVTEDRQTLQRNSRNIRNHRSIDRLNNERFGDRRRETNENSKTRLSDTVNRRNNDEFREYNHRRNANSKTVRQVTSNRRMERNDKNAPDSVFRFNENVANRRIQGREATNSDERLTRSNGIDQTSRAQRMSRSRSLENLTNDRRVRLNNRQNARDVTEIRRENTNRLTTRQDYSERVSRGTKNEGEARRDANERLPVRKTYHVRESRMVSREVRKMNSRDENLLQKRQDFSRTERVKLLQNITESSGHRNSREVRNLSRRIQDFGITIRERDISRNRVDIRDNDRTRERQMDNRLNVEMARKNLWRFDNKQVEQENGSTIGTWEIALYTLQAAYLISLLMHLPKLSGKTKMNMRYWPITTPAHVKVD